MLGPCLFVLVVTTSAASRSPSDNCPTDVPLDDQVFHIFKDSCFQFILTSDQEYHDAETYCNNHGGSLALVKTKDVQDFLMDKLKKSKRSKKEFWIGLNDKNKENEFVWEDGTNVKSTYSNWGQDEGPRSGWIQHDLEDCVAIVPRLNGEWHDFQCSTGILSIVSSIVNVYDTKKPFVCQYESQLSATAEMTTSLDTLTTTVTRTDAPDETGSSTTESTTGTRDSTPSTVPTKSSAPKNVPSTTTKEILRPTRLSSCPPFICFQDCGMDGFQKDPSTGCSICECGFEDVAANDD